LFGLLHQPRMIMMMMFLVVGRMSGRENQSTRKKPAPVAYCPAQIPHDLTWARTRTRQSFIGMPATNRLSYGTALTKTPSFEAYVFGKLATQWHLEHRCKALFETLCHANFWPITCRSHSCEVQAKL
jgi:hypothetical protein